jgi:hypothetical protein
MGVATRARPAAFLLLCLPALAAAAPHKKPKPPPPSGPRPAPVAPRHSDGLVEELGDGAVLDWTAGRLAVGAIAPADLRAPNVGVARAGAERVARQWAEKRIADAARKVPAAPGAAPRAADKPRDADVEYFSDGSTRVELELPLWALAPGEPAATLAPIVVDARTVALRPMVGVTLAAGATRYAGPTTFVAEAPAAAARATAADGGVVAVDLPEAVLAAAAKGRAPVVIVVKAMK